MNIEPGRIIDDFFEKKKSQYAIPVYQRNYEWPEEQCIKLVEYKEPGYTEFSLENPEDATSTSINYYVLQGERVKTTSYGRY